MLRFQTSEQFELRNEQHSFLNERFLLSNATAERLYMDYAGNLPIVDYHNHLDPVLLAANQKDHDIVDLWLDTDPYKHRAMRINGVPEYCITGNASPEKKFLAWAQTLPQCVGNPLFHWSHLELKIVFGIETLLTEKTADTIRDECNRQLRDRSLGRRDLLRFWNTEAICTSDDLLDDLTSHGFASDDSLCVLPSLRGDSILQSVGRSDWFERLEASIGSPVESCDDFLDALVSHLDNFDRAGCRLADHSLDDGFRFSLPSENETEELFHLYRTGNNISSRKASCRWQSFLLVFLAGEYARRDWSLQLHLGALRRTSSRLRRLSGFAGGYACIGSGVDSQSLVRFLDVLETQDSLPRTILYTLNPSDNPILATLTGSFAQDGLPGKIQFGPAWWYNDFADEIRRHLIALAGYSLLGHFPGMTTDSRSVLSFSRHDYFRRILCSLLGTWVENGELPNDGAILAPLVENICINNARKLLKK
jgi:glucuronate isomerase